MGVKMWLSISYGQGPWSLLMYHSILFNEHNALISWTTITISTRTLLHGINKF